MEKYIPLDALVAEIERLKTEALQKKSQCKRRGLEKIMHQIGVYNKILSFIDTLEVKEVDLEKEVDDVMKRFLGNITCREEQLKFAKHFFELGMRVNNPITAADRGTAEEIIINLKRVESDYRINLTKEITWVRNKAQKGEKV